MSFRANSANTWAVGLAVIVGELVGLSTGTGAVDCVRCGDRLAAPRGADGETGRAAVGADGETGRAAVGVDVVAADGVAVDVGSVEGVRVGCGE